ncbi:MAG TPA: hypothetical protein VIG74_01905, partial [Alphaproteobacteria bacterium]
MNGIASGKTMKAAGWILAGAFMFAALPEITAAQVTGQVRTPEARHEDALARLDDIQKLMGDDNAAFRLTLAFSLGQIADSGEKLSLRALRLLDDLHTDGDDMVRAEAAWQIGLIGLKYPARATYA